MLNRTGGSGVSLAHGEALRSSVVAPRRPSFAAGAAEPARPLLHMLSRATPTTEAWEYDDQLTRMYLKCMHEIASAGVSFEGQVALVTGAGLGSIALELVCAFLQGGATVVTAVHGSTPARLEGLQVDSPHLPHMAGRAATPHTCPTWQLRAPHTRSIWQVELRRIYEEHGSKGARLVLVPCNMASKSDVERLVAHVYDVME